MPSITPPRQCGALSTTLDGPCGRDTYDLIEIGVVTTPAQRRGKVMVEAWEILVEVPVCDEHAALTFAITEEVEPLVGVDSADLAPGYRCLPTFRISVNGRAA